MTGVYYYGARYYDPQIARFISPDSVVPDWTNPQAWNRYSYVLNNPLKYTDETGLFFDVLFDIASVAYDAYQFVRKPSGENAAFLAADVALAFVPFIPSGAGAVGRAAKTANKATDAAKTGVKAGKGAKTAAEVGTAFLPFTENYFADNLRIMTGMSKEAVKGKHAHHMLPKQHEVLFKKAVGDINIHDPKYGYWLDSSVHPKPHTKYNSDWKFFLKQNPDATLADIENQARELMRRYYGIEVSF